MQCVNILKKRSLDPEPWSCRTKRLCLRAELQVTECPMETSETFKASHQRPDQQVAAVKSRPPALFCLRCLGGEPKRLCLRAELQVTECPMETSETFKASHQRPDQQVAAVKSRPPALFCLRCLGGEPGHINHIIGH